MKITLAIPPQAQMPGDAVVASGIVAFWLGYLPTALGVIVSVMSMIWLGLQIYAFWKKRRESKRV